MHAMMCAWKTLDFKQRKFWIMQDIVNVVGSYSE